MKALMLVSNKLGGLYRIGVQEFSPSFLGLTTSLQLAGVPFPYLLSPSYHMESSEAKKQEYIISGSMNLLTLDINYKIPSPTRPFFLFQAY